jgi:hypothetical protein
MPYVPSELVRVVDDVPRSEIVAPDTGTPAAETTVPVTLARSVSSCTDTLSSGEIEPLSLTVTG